MPQFILKNRKIYTILFASLLFVAMFLLMFFSMRGDSGTVDEIAHIPSGYSYVKYHDFRLNPEHPPLAKALSGVSLAFMDLNGLKDDWSWEAINQWESGWYFLYEAGNDPAQVLFWARIPMVLLTLLLGLITFKWAYELYGRKIALLVLALFAFYPDLLAHGHLVTTDVAAAFGYVVAIYAFDKMLTKKTLKTIIWAGIVFGVAQLLKFSAFLLFGIFLVMILGKAWVEKEKGNFWKLVWEYFKGYFWMSLISVIVVCIVYIPFVWNTSGGIEHKVIELNLTDDPKTLMLRNMLHALENNPVTRAIGHYLLGVIMVFVRVAGGNKTFIMGHLSDKSISWFFPMAYLIKTPISVIILTLWSLILMFVFRAKDKKDAWQNWLFLTPVAVYWAFTLKGSLNIGIRHLIPTIPFILLFIGKQMHRYFKKDNIKTIQGLVVSILLIFMIISTLRYFPQYVGYFNEAVPRGERYNYLNDSSLDWGQDLLRLKDYVGDEEIETIKVDYFGGSVPSYYIPESVEWHSSYGPTTGWLAISATFYQSSKLVGEMENKWSYHWLDEFEPEAIIGGSILVFNISEQDLNVHPPTSPYEIKIQDDIGSITGRKVGI